MTDNNWPVSAILATEQIETFMPFIFFLPVYCWLVIQSMYELRFLHCIICISCVFLIYFQLLSNIQTQCLIILKTNIDKGNRLMSRGSMSALKFKPTTLKLLFFSLFLSTGSYTIQGRRVRVYQPEFDECWASGLVSQHDPISHIMEITLDKVKYSKTYFTRRIAMLI